MRDEGQSHHPQAVPQFSLFMLNFVFVFRGTFETWTAVKHRAVNNCKIVF